MKLTWLILPLIAAAVLAGGCGASVSDLKEVSTQYRGRTLYCQADEVGQHSGVMSCDFVRFYAENPDLLPSPAPTPVS